MLFGVNYIDRKKSRDLINNALTGGADYYSASDQCRLPSAATSSPTASRCPTSWTRSTRVSRAPSWPGHPQVSGGAGAYSGKPRPAAGPTTIPRPRRFWNPLQSYRVGEETWSGFVQANLEGERWSGNVGLRIVRTKTHAQAWDAKILQVIENGVHHGRPTRRRPAIEQGNTYTYAPAVPEPHTIGSPMNCACVSGAAKTMARPSVATLAPDQHHRKRLRGGPHPGL
ncbi:hypothetical protein ACRAWD_10475 [Caulobacter segnis]